MQSFEEPKIFNLLAREYDFIVEANEHTHPLFLSCNPYKHPVFLMGDKMCVALDYIIMYPKIHVHSFRFKGTNDEITDNNIQ